MPFVYRVLYRKYYVDEGYRLSIIPLTSGIGRLLAVFDRFVVDGLVEFCAVVIRGIGRLARRMQSGQVQTYGAVVLIGFVVVILIMAVTGGYFQ
jgi:NADH-quinone oxidoreductase subunit L